MHFVKDKEELRIRILLGKERNSMNKIYEYGGKHFVPHSKLGKVNSITDIKLRSDIALGFFDSDWAERIVKFKYSYKDFYKAMGNSEMDIFKCIENGRLYIPCEHELFIYEGMR